MRVFSDHDVVQSTRIRRERWRAWCDYNSSFIVTNECIVSTRTYPTSDVVESASLADIISDCIVLSTWYVVENRNNNVLDIDCAETLVSLYYRPLRMVCSMVDSVVCKRYVGACGGVEHRCSLQLSESMTSVTSRSRCCVKRTCVGALCVECWQLVDHSTGLW